MLPVLLAIWPARLPGAPPAAAALTGGSASGLRTRRKARCVESGESHASHGAARALVLTYYEFYHYLLIPQYSRYLLLIYISC